MPLGEGAQKYIRWAVLGLSVLAFIFVCVALNHCSFIDADGDGFGLFSSEVSDSRCLAYSDFAKENFDSGFKAGRAFGVMAALAIAFNMALVIVIHVFAEIRDEKKRNWMWLAVRILFIIGFICQIITFSAFSICDGGSCGVGAAGVIAILNIFILLALIVMSWLIPGPEHPMLSVRRYGAEEIDPGPPAVPVQEATNEPVEIPYEERQDDVSGDEEAPGDTIKITVVETPNGEKITTKEVTHADGSKTITETVEQMEPIQTSAASGSHAGKYGEA